MPQNFQFRTQFLQEAKIELVHFFGGRTALQDFGQDLAQGNKVVIGFGSIRFGSGRPVGQIQDPVQHAQGQGFAAHRTAALKFFGDARFQALFAFAMAIQMVLAFVRKKFQGAQEALSGFDGRSQGRI